MDKTHLRNSATSTAPTLPDLSWGLCDVGSTVTLWSGSSPLARGLHIGQPMLTREPRIIPARAGFTRTTTRPAARQRDHPRSRGVYPACRSASRRTAGSSPLARGLRQGDRCCDAEGRIIPARAGFTRQPGCLPPRHPDHPRSRGVYARFVSALTAYSGSSPLARGLRHGAMLRERLSRIIPARAGFTSPAPPDPWQPADHPRSRGVYAGETVPVARHLGSSPLARGLRRRCWARPTAAGIIPARAGFTPDD